MPADPAPTDPGAPEPNVPPGGTATPTSVLLYDLGIVLKARLDAALAKAGTGLRTRHVAVLVTLACGEPLSQRAAAAEADVDPATMVKVVDELERMGLLTRARNPRDRRAHDLTLTAAGREMVGRSQELLAGVDAEVFATLGDAGHAQLREWLTVLLEKDNPPAG